ncbi:MAG: CRISPR-associated endoribonuclease Cas2 [Firmicutes bacterium]|nr:CRISPR-associated endoribonuclease Cas2 [candidate division NPL-UPA2 bacterium]MBT9155527.1 CRISPR-associated endoribonuclease Cas2 [candidate division NPL-UPA2 bacterium]
MVALMVLVTYDVSTEDPSGARRLRLIARACENVGQRVQKSVFECLVEPQQLVILKNRLCSIIDDEKDSLRIYYLGKNWARRVDHFGKNLPFAQESPIIL